MKGIIFNAVEEAVTELHGADTWDELLERAGLDGAYTALGNYPDDELFTLVGAASALTEQATDDVLRILGRHALPILAAQVEELVDRDGHVFDFLASVHDIIHVEVRKLSPGATPPDLVAERLADDVLRLSYRSSRGLSALAEGLIVGAGDLFDQPIEVKVQPHEDGPQTAVFEVRLVSA